MDASDAVILAAFDEYRAQAEALISQLGDEVGGGGAACTSCGTKSGPFKLATGRCVSCEYKGAPIMDMKTYSRLSQITRRHGRAKPKLADDRSMTPSQRARAHAKVRTVGQRTMYRLPPSQKSALGEIALVERPVVKLSTRDIEAVVNQSPQLAALAARDEKLARVVDAVFDGDNVLNPTGYDSIEAVTYALEKSAREHRAPRAGRAKFRQG